MTRQDLTAGSQHQHVPPVDVALGDIALAVTGEQLDSVVSDGFSNLNIPQFHDLRAGRTPAAHPDTPERGRAFAAAFPWEPPAPTTALPPPCPWEVTSTTQRHPAVQQEEGQACHHHRHIVMGRKTTQPASFQKLPGKDPFPAL